MTRPTARLTAALGAVALAAGLSGCAGIAGVTDAPTATVGGVLAASQAQALAAQVVQTAQRAAAAPGADGDPLRDSAFTGDALVAAKADAKLASTLSQEQKDALTLTAAAPTVLAVSSGESYPRVMVVQTTRAKSGLPVLSLMTTPDARTPFKIAVSAPMLPSSEVPAFDQLTKGAPVLGDDATGLATDPEKLLATYAASLAFPAPPAPAPAPTRPSPTTPSPPSSSRVPRPRTTPCRGWAPSRSSTRPRTSSAGCGWPAARAPWCSPS